MNWRCWVATLAILPWLPAQLQGQPAPGRPSARQVRLTAFRDTQAQARAHKREARAARLESKRARLREALERARDRVQLALLRELHHPAGVSGPAAGPSLRRGLLGLGGLALLAGATEVVPPGEVVAHFLGFAEPPVPAAPATPPPLSDTLTELLMDQLDSDELETAGPTAQRALEAQRILLRKALGSAIAFPLPASATPGAQLLEGAFRGTLADTAQDLLGEVLPPDFGPLPPRRGASAPAGGGEREQAWNALQASKKDLVAAVREAQEVGSDIVVAATSLLGYGAFASVAYGLDTGASITGIFTSTPVSGAGVATGTLSAVANQFFLMAYASDAIAGAVLIHKLKEPYIDALLKVSDAEAAWAAAYQAYQNQDRTGSAAGSTGPAAAEAASTGPAAAPPAPAAAPAAPPQVAAATPLPGAAPGAGGEAPPPQASAASPRARPLWPW